MADPFLSAHAEAPRVFSLTGRVPISIRDQLVRAHYLADRLFPVGAVYPTATLLIAGAGVAGAGLAVLCARRQVRVTLIEASGAPFRLQQTGNSRWIDPVQYDWPAQHAQAGQWPVGGPSPAAPFGFAAAFSPAIARGWRNTLNLERRLRPHLQAHFGSRLHGFVPMPVGKPTHVTADILFPGASTPVTQQFDAAVLAWGLHSERVDVPMVSTSASPRFNGLRFWDADPFQQQGFGLPIQSTGEVMVSGSGDGALQDFIRLVTGQDSALQIFRLAVPTPIASYLQLQLGDAEQQANRALLWNSTETDDHPVLERLHRMHLLALQRWEQQQPASWASAMASLDRLTSGRQAQRVRLLHGCSHFSAAYALNRFVALLLARHTQLRHGIDPLMAGMRLQAARPARQGGQYQHHCTAGCWGPRHEVELLPAPRCGVTGGPVRRHMVDGLVVRHGIKQHSSATDVQRHSLPCHLP